MVPSSCVQAQGLLLDACARTGALSSLNQAARWISSSLPSTSGRLSEPERGTAPLSAHPSHSCHQAHSPPAPSQSLAAPHSSDALEAATQPSPAQHSTHPQLIHGLLAMSSPPCSFPSWPRPSCLHQQHPPFSLSSSSHPRALHTQLSSLQLQTRAYTTQKVVPATQRDITSLPELIEELQKQEIICSSEVATIMLYVDRARFFELGFDRGVRESAYKDVSIPIGHGQQMPAPSLHALCLELMRGHLLRGQGLQALDIGSGSGYMAACMAVMMGTGTQLLSLERQERLMELCAINIIHGFPHLLDKSKDGNLELQQGNVFDEAVLSNMGTFDVIHVGGAATEDMLPKLLGLLAPGGRMVVPVGPPLGLQWLTVVDKAADGSVSRKQEVEVKVMPLTPPASHMHW